MNLKYASELPRSAAFSKYCFARVIFFLIYRHVYSTWIDKKRYLNICIYIY